MLSKVILISFVYRENRTFLLCLLGGQIYNCAKNNTIKTRNMNKTFYLFYMSCLNKNIHVTFFHLTAMKRTSKSTIPYYKRSFFPDFLVQQLLIFSTFTLLIFSIFMKWCESSYLFLVIHVQRSEIFKDYSCINSNTQFPWNSTQECYAIKVIYWS